MLISKKVNVSIPILTTFLNKSCRGPSKQEIDVWQRQECNIGGF